MPADQHPAVDDPMVDHVYQHMRAAYQADNDQPSVGRWYVRMVLQAAIATLPISAIDPHTQVLDMDAITQYCRPRTGKLLASTVIAAWRDITAGTPADVRPCRHSGDDVDPARAELPASSAGSAGTCAASTEQPTPPIDPDACCTPRSEP